MTHLLRIPRWPAAVVSILIVILLCTALFAAHSGGWILLPGVARAAPQALTNGQVAALQGAQILLSSSPVPQLFLPVAVR